MNHGPPTSESLFPLKEAARYLPKRSGKRVHYSTLYRWATTGARGRKLETCLIGGIRYTSRQALERFIHAPVVPHQDHAPSVAAAIEQVLDAAGL